MEAQKTIFTPKEAAEYMGVSYRTILNWIDTGELKHSRIGDGWYIRITIDQIHDYLKNHEVEKAGA